MSLYFLIFPSGEDFFICGIQDIFFVQLPVGVDFFVGGAVIAPVALQRKITVVEHEENFSQFFHRKRRGIPEGFQIFFCHQPTETLNEKAVTEEETDTDIDELERLAEEARENLIESIKETSSRPDVVRGLGGNNVNLNATEDTAGADENSEVLI